ncbi:MAG: hypothetical protein M1829_005612 [Trizodia sp. TS-e1964]|nr:MAG: hypothetical protein M1829_005612 [Trizodia sp. TS-e1964]
MQAHSHARAALTQTQTSNLSAASEEHSIAAGEFSKASRATSDVEALRTLLLLEQHHKKLSQLLKFQTSQTPPVTAPGIPQIVASEAAVSSTDTSDTKNPAPTSAQATLSPLPHRNPQQLPAASPPHRHLPRDMASSIASNLASARGIPSNPRRRAAPVSPTSPAHPAGGRLMSLQGQTQGDAKTGHNSSNSSESIPRLARQGSSNLSQKKTALQMSPKRRDPISAQLSLAEAKGETEHKASNDDPFLRFYSTFETLLSKLSAPLAFAGLPLGTEDVSSSSEAEPTQTPESREVRKSLALAEPDLTSIFSRAALKATRENYGQPGLGPGGESFYVVPTAGGTISYAGILSRADQGTLTRGSSSLSNQDEDDGEFVDAHEIPPPASPSTSRIRRNRNAAGGKSVLTTIAKKTPALIEEELRMENAVLRQLSDNLSKRLHMWETTAQSSSMALQQSLRLMHPPGASPTPSDGGTSEAGDSNNKKAWEKVRELEDEIALGKREWDRISRENEKLKVVLSRYRERWERLKEGARVRREGGANENPKESPVE